MTALWSRGKIRKNRQYSIFSHLGARLRCKGRFLSIFDDFAPISNCCRLPVSGSFLPNFFLFESREYKFSFFICGIAHTSIFGTVRAPTVATSIFRLKWPFFCDLPSLQRNAIFLFFEIFTKCFKKLVRYDLSFRLEKNLVQTDHYWRSYWFVAPVLANRGGGFRIRPQ